MILRAEKSVTIKHALTIAAIWTKVDRPDLSLILGALKDGRIRAAEKKILSSYLESIGLLNHGSITRAGEELMRSGAAWVPEHGLFRFYLIDDPILGPYPQVIHFVRVKEAECRTKEEPQIFAAYRDIEGREYASWLEGELMFKVSFQEAWDQAPKVMWDGASIAEAQVTWDGKKTTLIVRSTDKVTPFKRTIQPYEELDVERTMKGLLPDFDLEADRYPMMYSEVKDKPDLLRDMKTTLRGSDLGSKRLTLFSAVDESDYDVTLQDVVLTPYGRDDAINWVSHLLLLDIENGAGYPTPPYVEAKASAILAAPGFRGVDLSMPGGWSGHLESLCALQEGRATAEVFASEAIRRIRLAFDLYPEKFEGKVSP